MRRTLRFPLVALASAALFLTACQPTVGVSPRLRPLTEVALEAEATIPVVPDAAEGRKVFELRCAVCHGPEGLGNGPLSQTLKAPHKDPFLDTMRLLGFHVQGEDLPSRPANFHNLVQMRLNSPFSMFETVRLGRPHTAMPAFGPKPSYGANDGMPGPRSLPDEELWHVVFYEWTFATTVQGIERGRDIYENRMMQVRAGDQMIPATCAGCHGPAGDGRGGQYSGEMARSIWGWNLGRGAGIFTDRGFLAQRKPTELFARIRDGLGLMPAYRELLSEEEIWALVDYIWTFMYRYTPPRGEAAKP